MKILDILQSGKRSIYVSQGGRYGQISRALVIPANPRTEDQLNARQVLGTYAHNWRTLTEPQRLAWIAAAALIQTRPRLGQSGPMTGSQLYVRTNCNNVLVGEPAETEPPAIPAFDANIIQSLAITNPGGVVALNLNCSGTSGAFNTVWATSPKSAGCRVTNDFYFLGTLPAVAGGKSNITSLYTAKFGAPPVGTKVFARSHQILNGYADLPHQWSAITPASS